MTKKRKRALTVQNILTKKRNLLPFDGPWKEAFGQPEVRGSWIIWADSGHGKTTFTMKLLKYMSQFERCLYNSMEEGDSESIRLSMVRNNMSEIPTSRYLFLDNENIWEMSERLLEPRSPKIVVIDSVQYCQLNWSDYVRFKETHPNHLFIWLSHADGKLPEGMVARRIRFDSMIKIRVEGYAAFALSRYREGEGKPFIIWPEGAQAYHGFTDLNETKS